MLETREMLKMFDLVFQKVLKTGKIKDVQDVKDVKLSNKLFWGNFWDPQTLTSLAFPQFQAHLGQKMLQTGEMLKNSPLAMFNIFNISPVLSKHLPRSA